MSTGYAVLGLGMVAAGPITNLYGARAARGGAAALCALAALLGVLLLRGVETDEPERENEAAPGVPQPARVPVARD